MSSGCDRRVFQYDDQGIADEAGESDTTDTTGEGGDDESETGGSIECSASVESLTITSNTDPASVECVTKVSGDLVIGPSGLTSLDMLGELREVGGMLYIVGNAQLEDLAGLQQLQKVGWLFVRRNGALTDLSGLDALVVVDRISVINNDALVSLAGLPEGLAPTEIDIAANDLLSDLDELPAFVATGDGSPLDVQIEDHAALTSVAGLATCCSSQPLALELARNAALVDLDGLETFTHFDTLRLLDNRALDDLTGVDATEIGTFELSYDPCLATPAPALENFLGLEQLLRVDRMTIGSNPKLTSFAGLDGLTDVGELFVRNNAALDWQDVFDFVEKTGADLSSDSCGGIGGPTCPTEDCPSM